MNPNKKPNPFNNQNCKTDNQSCHKTDKNCTVDQAGKFNTQPSQPNKNIDLKNTHGSSTPKVDQANTFNKFKK